MTKVALTTTPPRKPRPARGGPHYSLSPVPRGEGRGEGPSVERRGSRASQRGAGPAAAVPTLTVALSVAAALAFAIPGVAASLQFDAATPFPARPWRWLTCHWTHWSGSHLFWSGLSFAVLGAICERTSRARFAACTVLAALAIPPLLATFQPELRWYRGLSGIDSALFALIAVTTLRARGRQRLPVALALVALLLFAAKVAFELTTGAAVFADAAGGGFSPVPRAHAAGAVVGVVVGLAGRAPREGEGRHD